MFTFDAVNLTRIASSMHSPGCPTVSCKPRSKEANKNQTVIIIHNLACSELPIKNMHQIWIEKLPKWLPTFCFQEYKGYSVYRF